MPEAKVPAVPLFRSVVPRAILRPGALRDLRRAAKRKLRQVYARANRQRCKATYIAVTGSSGKSTTVALLSHILSATSRIVTQVEGNSFETTWKTLGKLRPPLDYVIFEIGTSAPGEIAALARDIKPDIGIVTLVGLDHYAAFRSKDAVALEKGALIAALPATGMAILNNDDPYVRDMARLTQAQIVTTGSAGADFTRTRILCSKPGKLTFSLAYGQRELVLTTKMTGAHCAVPVTSAAACALKLGVPEHIVVERVASFEPMFGRCSVHRIEGGPTFILDSNKAPYYSLTLALDVMRECKAPRRRIVIGQLSDYAGNPKTKYREAYRYSRQFADQVIFIGSNAHRAKASAEDIRDGRFAQFHDVEKLSRYIKSTAIPGEVILLKSSRHLHLERIMLDWESSVACWANSCGKNIGCLRCGHFAVPYDRHPRRRKWRSAQGLWPFSRQHKNTNRADIAEETSG